ncbi:MAG: sigma 54-interacting transcriptional regulator [Sporolactobacillus sp.]
MVAISGERIKPIHRRALLANDACPINDLAADDYLFIEEKGQLSGYLSMKEFRLDPASPVTPEWLHERMQPLTSACVLNQDISPIDLFRVIGEPVTLVKDAAQTVIGYITREDLIVALFKDDDQNTDLLKTILTSIPMGIFVLDSNKRMINFNEAALKMTKKTAQQVYNQPAEIMFNRRDIDHVFETGESLLNQILVNEQIGILADYSPILNTKNSVDGVVVVVQDLPMIEKMAMEIESIKNLNADLNAVLSSIYDEILVLNASGVLIRCSETMTPDYWVINFKKFIGQNLLMLDGQGPIQASIIRRVMKDKKKYSEIQATARGKKIMLVCTPILGENGDLRRMIIALRDITETSRLKSELNKYKKELDDFKKESIVQQRMIFRSAKMEELMIRARKVSEFSSTVLISGESGVGKEVIAQVIHQMGRRSEQPFIKLNCGAIPENLLESELFGYVNGAFTGASAKGKKGYFEQANGGVLFLDEIGELSVPLQVKLLRVLQEEEVTPLGSTRAIPIDVQIVAATNRNLKDMVRGGMFRADLYYRLNVIPIHVPPLRERPEDVPVLALHFLNQFNERYHRHFTLMPDALNLLELYPWPGNIRELQNVMERLMVVSDNEFIQASLVSQFIHFDQPLTSKDFVIRQIMPMKEAKEKLEDELISLAMRQFKTTSRAAEVLGISQSTVSRKYQRIMKGQ